MMLALGFSGAMAAAQMTGSRLPGSSTAMVGYAGDYEEALAARPDADAARAVRQLAACALATSPVDSKALLIASTDAEADAANRRLSPVLTRCFEKERGRGELKVGPITFRGAIAEAALAREPLPTLTVVTPTTIKPPIWLSSESDVRVVQEMAICLAEQHPTESLALVRSAFGTPAETTAFAAVTPLISSCLIQGATLKTNRVGIRLALATALYHRINDPAAAPAVAAGDK